MLELIAIFGLIGICALLAVVCGAIWLALKLVFKIVLLPLALVGAILKFVLIIPLILIGLIFAPIALVVMLVLALPILLLMGLFGFGFAAVAA